MLTNTPLADALRVNEVCHRAGIGFIWTDVRGVFARVFCDFGPAFTVVDTDGAARRRAAAEPVCHKNCARLLNSAHAVHLLTTLFVVTCLPGLALRGALLQAWSRTPVSLRGLRALRLLASSGDDWGAAAGEEAHSGIVAGITGGSPTIVTCVEDERLEFQACAQGSTIPGRSVQTSVICRQMTVTLPCACV